MKTKHRKKSVVMLIMLLGIISIAWFAGNAAAVGTPAGTAITNKATGTYTDANDNTYAPVTSNTVTTTVSQVGGIAVFPLTTTQNGAPGGTTYFTGTITNTGNGTDTFTLSSTTGLPSGWTTVLYVDQNRDGLLTDADKVNGNYVEQTGPMTLTADGISYLVRAVTAPAGATAGATATLNVTWASSTFPAQTQTATRTTNILAAVITVTKTTAPVNPQPGDTVTYTVSYNNSGTAAGFLTIVSDPVPANTTYKTASLKINNVVKTDAADGDEADYNVTNPGKVTYNLGTVAPGASGTVSFQVTVNAGIAYGTSVSNTASLSYRTNATDAGTTTTANTNISSFTVAQFAGLLVTPATITTNQLPGDTNIHAFTVKNNGNGADTYNLSSVGLFWTWAIYRDVNQDGLYTPGVDTLIADTNGDGKLDTGAINAGDTKYFVATSTVTGYNGQQGQHTLTAISVTDGTITGTSIKYINVQTPVISIAKSVTPAGNQPPGTELTYTITIANSGAAEAKTVVITDVLSTYLTYTSGSITVVGAAQTDAGDMDFGRFDGATNTVIVSLPSIAPGGTISVIFKATIK